LTRCSGMPPFGECAAHSRHAGSSEARASHGKYGTLVLSADDIRKFRRLGGSVVIFAGAVIIAASRADEPLGVALLLVGAFILAHLGIEEHFHQLREDFEAKPDAGLREFASAFVSTSGVILGLLAVFGDKEFSLTIKVGIGALVADILVGVVLIGLLLAGASDDDQPAWNLIRLVFNVALWAFALGLLCVATALIYT
jgi:hypothetical protein